MNIRSSRLAGLVLTAGLAACASTPSTNHIDEPSTRFDPAKDPYWKDPRWDKALLDAIQSRVHDPVGADDVSTPDLHATVKFTYMEGNIQYPEIVQSTGDQAKDALVIQQVASAHAPEATGLQSSEPHEFVLDLDMPTPYESFLAKVYLAIEQWKVYPKEPIIQGVGGVAKVDFNYLDGKASGIAMVESSQHKDLDQSAVRAVTKATMPPVPAEYAGKNLHLEAVFCYYLGSSPDTFLGHPCPSGRNVIVVSGWRIRR